MTPSQSFLSSVINLTLKILFSNFKYLYLFERVFFASSGSLHRQFLRSFCVGLCYTLECFFKKNRKKQTNKQKKQGRDYWLLRFSSFFTGKRGLETP